MIRIGIVGAGQIVENSHLPALLSLPNVSVQWVIDSNPARSELLSLMYRVPARNVEAIGSLLDEVDACLLAIPVGARESLWELCSAKNKAVLAEKPFATSEQRHQTLCDAFAPHSLGVCFQRRFYSAITAMRAIHDNRLFGRLERVSFAIGGVDLKSGGARRYLADPKLSGGGVIIELGVHALDQILFASSASEVAVDRVRGIRMDGIDYDAVFDSTLTTKDGPINVHGDVTRLRPIHGGFVFTMENAVVGFGLGPDAVLRVTSRNGGPTFALDPLPGRGALTSGQAFYMLWEEFIGGIERKAVSRSSASTSLLTTRWVDKIYSGLGAS